MDIKYNFHCEKNDKKGLHFNTDRKNSPEQMVLCFEDVLGKKWYVEGYLFYIKISCGSLDRI